MTPIHKANNLTHLGNYRPVSVLCILSKVIERQVHNSLYGYLSRNKLLHEAQSGFRPNHSCETAVTKLIHMWSSAMNSNQLCGIVLLDLRKAFDLVCHNILLEKLKAYQCSDTAVKWFSSYLQGRTQASVFKGKVSEQATIKVGVPQGSIIGPLMFILYMNDLPLAAPDSNLDMYADDTTMTATGNTVPAVEQKLNSQMEPVQAWCENNRMVINVDKTKSMLITTAQKRSRLPPHQTQLKVKLGGKVLAMAQKDRLLGVTIDQDLTWAQHIQRVLQTANAHLALLRRIKQYLPVWSRITFYNAYILPHIDYCCTIWGGGNTVDKLTKFQRKAARVILDAHIRTPTTTLLKTLRWMPVRDRIDYKRSILIYKSLNSLAPTYCVGLFKRVMDVNSRSTRLSDNPNKLYINPNLKKGHIQKTIAVCGAHKWNGLDYHVTSAPTLQTFKTRYMANYYKT